MKSTRYAGIILVLFCISVQGADVILNEYNAVDKDLYLRDDGTDSRLERIQGNGGDWFELVIVGETVDMRGWQLEVWDDGAIDETLTLSNNAFWATMRGGTILTISEDHADDISFTPSLTGGDWWINIQSADGIGNAYITNPTKFKVSNKNWQLLIKDDLGNVVFGKAGEGIVPGVSINDEEIFKLEANPSAAIFPTSTLYNDGKSSTFGMPNIWSSGDEIQNFEAIRAWVPEPTALLLLGSGLMLVLRRRRN